MKSSFRFTPDAAMAAPTAVSLSYIAAVSICRYPSAIALSTTGWASAPGIRKVPKPRRGIATPCIVIVSMMFSFLGFPAGGSVRSPFCAAGKRQAITRAAASDGCFGLARPDEFRDGAFECRSALHRRLAVLAEVDPSLVEAIEHPDPRQWISRSLRAENLLPALARHRLDPDGALQHRGEGSGEIVRRYACGPLQFDDPRPAPVLAEKRGGQAADILRRDHREQLVGRLQEAAQHAFVARRGNVPERILHEPAGPQEGDRKADLLQRKT